MRLGGPAGNMAAAAGGRGEGTRLGPCAAPGWGGTAVTLPQSPPWGSHRALGLCAQGRPRGGLCHRGAERGVKLMNLLSFILFCSEK